MAQGGVIVIPSGIASRSRSFGIRDAMKRGISGVALGGWFCLLPFAFCLSPLSSRLSSLPFRLSTFDFGAAAQASAANTRSRVGGMSRTP